jgi:hypothetical protein
MKSLAIFKNHAYQRYSQRSMDGAARTIVARKARPVKGAEKSVDDTAAHFQPSFIE